MSTWITAAEFAKRMGCSRSNVTQAIATERIQPKYVRRDGTRVRVNTACIADWEATSNRHQQRGLLPMAWGGSTKITEEELDLAPSWDRVAARLNDYLGDGWPGPPYDGDQAATLALCLEMAREPAAMRGAA
jgi:hypothetical protein